MQTFSEFLIEATDRNDLKKIVLNALGISFDRATEHMQDSLADFDDRKNILNVQAIKDLPDFDDIVSIINANADKYTVGSFIDKLYDISKPVKDE